MYRNIYRNKNNLRHYFGTFCYKTLEEAKKVGARARFAICIKAIEVPVRDYMDYPSIFDIDYEETTNYIIYK